ncbi:unnamed protein product [Rotaria sordida]|uniref:Uncharacterized protein n=1 Tax=Rotaria sordida TaxID=392033 RepID=A0A815QKN0_9BILA|nr:unnamed protein product [Rotaria sordida]CAF4076318.1 unnamed protein product [Rotaria sordida]
MLSSIVNDIACIERANNTIDAYVECSIELDMTSLFSYEFSPAPLLLCDTQDCNLLNQQQKSEIIKLFEKECPIGFSTKNQQSIMLLSHNVIPEFQNYDRIDIVFDADQSKFIKSFIRRHGYQNKEEQQQYGLKPNDILDSSRFNEFVYSNRAELARVIRSYWSQNELIDLLPVNKHLIIGGPQHETIKLFNNKNSSLTLSIETLYNLESDHIEADTRIFLHTYNIQMEDDGDLIKFGDDLTITTEPLQAAEELLVSCYKNSRTFKSSISRTTSSSFSTTTKLAPETSLNDLRKTMALKYFKNSTLNICTKLPSTSNSFYQYCQRTWRQVYIWKKAFEQYNVMNYYSIENYGYQRANDVPNDISLSKCVKCTSGCQRCKCSTNNLPCTSFSGYSIDQCENCTSIQMKTQSTDIIKTKRTSSVITKYSFDDYYDKDKEDDTQIENSTNIDYENDDEDDDNQVALELIYDNYIIPSRKSRDMPVF